MSSPPGSTSTPRWRIHLAGQPGGYFEPVQIRKLDIKQHQLGPQPGRLGQRCFAVGCLADHVEPVSLQERPGRPAKPWMIVDDQD
jgi:hypothetical protein